MKLTGAAILVSRGMKVLQAAPAAYPYRSAAEGFRRWQRLATASTLLTITLLVEEDAATAGRVPFPLRSEEEVRKAVLLAVGLLMRDGGRDDVRVEWSSLTSMPLDGAEGYG